MSFHPDKNLPGCMMPDGGECCSGHAAVVEDWHKQRREIELLRAQFSAATTEPPRDSNGRTEYQRGYSAGVLAQCDAQKISAATEDLQPIIEAHGHIKAGIATLKAMDVGVPVAFNRAAHALHHAIEDAQDPKSAPVQRPPQHAERLPSGDTAGAGADTVPQIERTYEKGIEDANQMVGALWSDLFNKDMVKAAGAEYFDRWRARIKALAVSLPHEASK